MVLVDARGEVCPQPLIRARLALASLAPGESIQVMATDPHAELDLEVFCATSGHQLVSVERSGDEWHFVITHGISADPSVVPPVGATGCDEESS